jgi:hypothetical protein
MFDPYHKWLGIPKDQRPPTLYQLLSVSPHEQDLEVIEEAVVRQTTHVRAYQIGPYTAECTQVLKEIAQARVTLLNPAKRQAYDEQLAKAGKGPAAAIEDASAAAITARPPQPVAARAANPTADHDDKPERAARLQTHSKKAKRAGAPIGLFVGIGVGVSVLLLMVIAGAALFFFSGVDAPAKKEGNRLVAQGAPPDKKTNDPAVPIPKANSKKDEAVLPTPKKEEPVLPTPKKPEQAKETKDNSKPPDVKPPPKEEPVVPVPKKPAFESRATWVGYMDDSLPMRLEVGDVTEDRFTGHQRFAAPDGSVKHRTRIIGRVAGDAVSFSYQSEDIEKDGGYQPCRFAGTIKGNTIVGSYEELAGDKKGSFNLHLVAAETGWSQLDTRHPIIKDGYLHLNPRDPRSAESPSSYSTTTNLFKGPIEIAATVRSEGKDIRLHAFKGSYVNLNSEARLDELRVGRPDGSGKLESGSVAVLQTQPLLAETWYKLRWVITEHGMELFVGDQLVFREKRRYDLSAPTPVRIGNGGGLDIKYFRVSALDPKVGIALPAKPAKINGIAIKQVDLAIEPPRSFQMGKTFDIAKSWTLSLEVLVPDQPDEPRQIFFWGDDRPGRDALFLTQKGDRLMAAVCDTADDKGTGVSCAFPKTLVGKWVAVLFIYDASSKELQLYLDGTLAVRDKCAVTPRLDRPMPVWIGGTDLANQRFPGKVRSVWLANK